MMASDNENTSADMNEDPSLLSDQEDREEVDSHPLGNPAPPPDLDLELLRGDRIGDTAYSGKWCIEIVMKLMQSNVVVKDGSGDSSESKPGTKQCVGASGDDGKVSDSKPDLVDMDEDLQNQVGVLWDMTGNEEVCTYLHSIGAVDSICFVIANSRCPRATEMCAGMLANIITHDVMWKTLHNDSTIYSILVPLLANEDQPTLLEVTRFFNTALCHTEHSYCYVRLFEGADTVLQELARILSGSTNGELLKQTAEMTYNLMDLDQDESKFCAVLAEADFVLACVEASKELGYEEVTPGQNCLMDIFYNFTTYQAGALALEPCLPQVAQACSTYLSHLCRRLSLSNTCTTITSALATLTHLFGRHQGVRAAVMSSPKLINYILKVLVTVYTRLGLYSAISSSAGQGLSAEVKDKSRWTDLEDTPSRGGAVEVGSWSERAVSAGSSNNPTPEASPLTQKEGEISWSERRVGTPLAHQYQQQQHDWKRPQGTKRVPRKKEGGRSPVRKREPITKDGDVQMEDQSEEIISGLSKEDGDETSEQKLNEQAKENNEKDHGGSEQGSKAKQIEHSSRFDNGSSRNSGGFSYDGSMEEDGSKNSDSIDTSSQEEDSATHSTNRSPSSHKADSAGLEGTQEDIEGSASVSHLDDSSGEEDEDKEEKVHEGKADLDNFEVSADSCMAGEDKYHKLLGSLHSFFIDLLTALCEAGVNDPGAPFVKDLMVYLEKRANKTEIRALVKCVSDQETSTPTLLEPLLSTCKVFKCSRLERVVKSFLSRSAGGSESASFSERDK